MNGDDYRLELGADDTFGLEEWDRQHAKAVELLRELATRRDVPRAFVLIVAQDFRGAPGVQTVAACPTDEETTSSFVELATEAFAVFMAKFRP